MSGTHTRGRSNIPMRVENLGGTIFTGVTPEGEHWIDGNDICTGQRVRVSSRLVDAMVSEKGWFASLLGRFGSRLADTLISGAVMLILTGIAKLFRKSESPYPDRVVEKEYVYTRNKVRTLADL
jgi:hypothetical protein